MKFIQIFLTCNSDYAIKLSPVIRDTPPPLLVEAEPKKSFQCGIKKMENQEYKKRKLDRKNRGR